MLFVNFERNTILSPKASPVLTRKRKQQSHLSSSTADYGTQIRFISRAVFAAADLQRLTSGLCCEYYWTWISRYRGSWDTPHTLMP
jgi:hypothetical protein